MLDLDGRWAWVVRGAQACRTYCVRAGKWAWKHIKSSAKYLHNRWGYPYAYGPNSYLFGRGAYGYRKGWLNRGPVRLGWGYNQAKKRMVFRLAIGWPKKQQTNWFKRSVGHRHPWER